MPGKDTQERSRNPTVLVGNTSDKSALLAQRHRQALPTTRWSDFRAFLSGFVARPAQVGSIIPSSRSLERRLVTAAGIRGDKTVVELGPGTGGTTRALLNAMPSEARLLAIELSPSFHVRLTSRLRDPRLIMQLGSAEDLLEVLANWRLGAPDVIISGIPFSTMTANAAERIAHAIGESLAPGGRFIAYQVRAHVVDYIRPHLGDPETQWELLNIPPVRVFRWVKNG